MSTRSTIDSEQQRCFVLAPNLAPDWRQNVRFFAVTSVVVLGIALAFTWHGFWPILPFAGLELMALGAALYLSARRSLDREVIYISDSRICVEKGRGRVQRRWEMQPAWTEVVLRQLPRRWEHTQLVLRTRETELELGSFLDADERKSLARELARCVGPIGSSGITQSRLGSATVLREAEGSTGSLDKTRLGDRAT